jgi:hypothetical protein
MVTPGESATNAQKRAEVAQKNLETLDYFVTRARRVEEHSLAKDKERLEKWASGSFSVRQTEKLTLAIWSLPDEEYLDSLAARCRPFILQRDAVQYGKVLNALKYFINNDDAELQGYVQSLRAGWRRLDPDNDDMLAYLSSIGPVGGLLGKQVTDRDLAYAWLYGDLIHAERDKIVGVGDLPSISGFKLEFCS